MFEVSSQNINSRCFKLQSGGRRGGEGIWHIRKKKKKKKLSTSKKVNVSQKAKTLIVCVKEMYH